MAQFVLDTSQLGVDVLGPIVYATASADLQGLTATATAEVTNVVTATAKTKMAGIKASAESRIDFSIVEDDAEILLLI